jgi:hypothetical protein
VRRTTVVTSVAALLAALLVPLSPAASAAPGDGIAPSTGSSNVAVGGGNGLSGPASRAQVGYAGHLTLGSDGSVLVVAGSALLRVDPASDQVSVAESYDAAQEHGAVDVAILGTTTYLLTSWGLDRINGAGERSRLWTGHGNAVDVGADGVAWVTTDYNVTRVLPDGTATAVPGTDVMDASDIAVSDSGSTAYVLDHAPQRHGIYEVTAAGVGARVAGTGYRDDSLRHGQLATAASMESVQGISLDASTITVTSGEYQLLATFPIGGVVSVRSTGRYGAGVDSVGGTTVAVQGPTGDAVVRLTAAGTTRILGADPAQPWSPDGVLAADAYTGALRGAAPIDEARLVFVTASGMVREVDADGRLRSRATLPPITTRGKVAAAPDGTAYVINDSGRVVRVPAIGSAQVLPIVATATDVEVLPDGRLAVADSAPARILLAQPDGTGVTVLTGLTGAPTDLGVDDTSILVADDGLRRVGLDGSAATLLTGGRPTAALRARDGIWTGQLHGPDTSAMVLHPGGGLGALRAVYNTGRQAQAVAGGDVLVTRDDSVLRVTNGAAAPEQAGPAATATPGEGRVTLTTGELNTAQGIVIRARRGTEPPRDMWDGEMAGTSNTVFRIGGQLVVPGEQWTFAVFTSFYSEAAPNTVVASWTTPAVVTAAANPDTTPPPLPTEPRLYTDHDQIRLTYNDPSAWQDQAALDFDRTVVRYTVGSTPPATPTEGTGLDAGPGTSNHGVTVPNPVRGQDYGLSIFALDFRGNFSRWSTVTRLDYQPPGVVTDVAVTPSYRSVRVQFTEPTDGDYRGVAFTIAEGDGVPTPPSDDAFFTTSEVVPGGLAMDTTYTIALWTRDWAGNVSAPVTRTFRTLLDATPPGPVSGLTAQGGSYSITASWTNPTDSDFTSPVAELVDPATGTATPCPILNGSKTSCTWRLKGDATRTVRVRARDVNGNLSAPLEATATTLPDSNGTPAIPEPVTWSADGPTTVTVRLPKPTHVDLAAQWYVLRPSGEPTASPLATGTLSSSTSTIAKSITLPDASQAYDLYLYVTDLNGNRGEKVLTGVHGSPDPAGRPSMPGNVKVTAPFDNTIKVTWGTREWSAPVSEWVATATSADGSTVRTVRVPGTSTNLGLGDLPGRQSWSVRLYGVNDLGSGTASLAQSVLVGDATAPAPVTAMTSTPAYDTTTLRWTNPAAFDLAKVVVLRRDRTSGALATLYSGSGTTARSTGLVAGRSYSYEVRSYDTLGNVSLPATLTTTQSSATLSVASTVGYGSVVRASGVLSVSGKALTGRTVGLFAQRIGATTWSKVASATTTSTGTFAFSAKPNVNMRYRVGYAGAGTTGGSYSPIRTVTVAPSTSIRASRTSLYLGGSVTLSTTVSPNHAGRLVALQRWSGTRWVTLTSRTLWSTSAASATIKPTVRGYNSYRWYLPAHTDHGSSVSATLKVRVY